MTTHTLTAFIEARLSEDEAVVRAAHAGPWTADIYGDVHAGRLVAAHTQLAYAFNATHIARHDPARVLAEVEAKRRIVALAESAGGHGAQIALQQALRLLAQPYADHPDYREEWKP